MPDLKVRHVIFTRVERAYSPHNTSGYQVVYHSPALGEEVGQIARALQCFETGQREHERSQFFWTDRGQAVLARSVSLLQPDPDVIDAGQRPAFLAHALVFSWEEFENVRNDPFAIFEAAEDADLFASDEEQLIAYLEKAPPEKLTTPRRTPARSGYLLEGWPREELWKCFCLAWQAQALKQQSQSLLLLTDDQHEIYNALSIMLMLIPPEKRVTCTFDTFVDGCYPTAGAFWVLGSSKGRRHPGLKPVFLAEQRLEVKGGDDGFLDPKVLRRTASSQEGFAGGARYNIKSDCRVNKKRSQGSQQRLAALIIRSTAWVRERACVVP